MRPGSSKKRVTAALDQVAGNRMSDRRDSSLAESVSVSGPMNHKAVYCPPEAEDRPDTLGSYAHWASLVLAIGLTLVAEAIFTIEWSTPYGGTAICRRS